MPADRPWAVDCRAAGTKATISAESSLAAVNCVCSCSRVVQPNPCATTWALMAIKLVMVLLVSAERVWVGVMRDRASMSVRGAEALTTVIPAAMAELTSPAADRIVAGMGGVATMAALRALTLASTELRTPTIAAPSLWTIAGLAEAKRAIGRSFAKNLIL